MSLTNEHRDPQATARSMSERIAQLMNPAVIALTVDGAEYVAFEISHAAYRAVFTDLPTLGSAVEVFSAITSILSRCDP